MYSTLTIALLLWTQVYSISNVDLQAPGHAEEGGSALLGCTYDMEGEQLYSLRWYKDGKEFYRYAPSNVEPIRYFTVPGVVVNLSRSSSSVVALEHLRRESAGLYRCEVFSEGPYFNLQLDEKNITIHLEEYGCRCNCDHMRLSIFMSQFGERDFQYHLGNSLGGVVVIMGKVLPKSEPRVTGLQNEYQIGETLEANCTSGRSRPSAQIKWLVNEQPAPVEYQRGPWERRARERADARETILGLAFTLRPYHFRHGILKLKCQAAIAPLYQKEVAYHVLQARESEEIDAFEEFEKLHLYENRIENASLESVFATEPKMELIAHDHGSAVELSVGTLLLPYVIFLLVL